VIAFLVLCAVGFGLALYFAVGRGYLIYANPTANLCLEPIVSKLKSLYYFSLSKCVKSNEWLVFTHAPISTTLTRLIHNSSGLCFCFLNQTNAQFGPSLCDCESPLTHLDLTRSDSSSFIRIFSATHQYCAALNESLRRIVQLPIANCTDFNLEPSQTCPTLNAYVWFAFVLLCTFSIGVCLLYIQCFQDNCVHDSVSSSISNASSLGKVSYFS
jgi:hypothetical protein